MQLEVLLRRLRPNDSLRPLVTAEKLNSSASVGGAAVETAASISVSTSPDAIYNRDEAEVEEEAAGRDKLANSTCYLDNQWVRKHHNYSVSCYVRYQYLFGVIFGEYNVI